jgi:hypothetical protein
VYEITESPAGWAKMWGCDDNLANVTLASLKRHGTCDVTVLSNGDVTLLSRRLRRGCKSLELGRLRTSKWRARSFGDGDVTPPCDVSVTGRDQRLEARDQIQQPTTLLFISAT